MIVAGIDPGKSGALSILYPDNVPLVFDVPTIKLRGKEVAAWTEWETTWSNALGLNTPDLIVIENVAARPAQGVTSMFSFGRSLGFAHAIAARAKVRIEFVTPSVWKGKIGLLNSSKGASREMARTLCPRHACLYERVKDDGRAEATLLAHYGRRFISG